MNKKPTKQTLGCFPLIVFAFMVAATVSYTIGNRMGWLTPHEAQTVGAKR